MRHLDKLDQWFFELTTGKRGQVAAIVAVVIQIISYLIQMWMGPVNPQWKSRVLYLPHSDGAYISSPVRRAKMKAGQTVWVYPHGTPSQTVAATVNLISPNGRSISIGLQALQSGESLEKALKKYLADHHEAKEESTL